MNKLLRIAVSAALFAFVASRTDWAHVLEAMRNLRLEYFAGAVGLLLAAQVISAWRWQLMARGLGLSASIPQMTNYYFIGMFFNLVLPTSVGGDVVRAWYLQKWTGKRLASFVSVLMDRLNGLLVLLLMASVAAIIAPLSLPTWIPLFVWTTTAVGFGGLMVLPWLARFGRNGKARQEQVQTMLQVLRKPRLALLASIISLAVQASSVAIVWMAAQALRAPVPASYLWILVPMVSILTLVPISVNGVGVREGATALFLAPLGIADSTALTLAFLWFLVYFSAGLLGGLVYLFGNFPKPQPSAEVISDHGPLDRDSHQGRTGQFNQAA